MSKLNEAQGKLKNSIARIKALKAKASNKMTIARLKQMKGFEDISNEMAQKTIESMNELASILLKQMNRRTLNEQL